MTASHDHEPTANVQDKSRGDGFAAMGILALTIVFIVIVLVALI